MATITKRADALKTFDPGNADSWAKLYHLATQSLDLTYSVLQAAASVGETPSDYSVGALRSWVRGCAFHLACWHRFAGRGESRPGVMLREAVKFGTDRLVEFRGDFYPSAVEAAYRALADILAAWSERAVGTHRLRLQNPSSFFVLGEKSIDIRVKQLARLARRQPVSRGDVTRIAAEIAHEHRRALASIRPPPCADAPNPKFEWAQNYTSVMWFGISYSFNPTQAAYMKVLFDAWAKGLSVHEKDVHQISGETITDFRIAKVFKKHDSLYSMLQRADQPGHWTLMPPRQQSRISS